MTLESAAAPTSGVRAGAKHVVTRVNLIRQSRHAGMDQRRQCLNGDGAWFVRNAATAMSTWW
jgi:hypothetical protein